MDTNGIKQALEDLLPVVDDEYRKGTYRVIPKNPPPDDLVLVWTIISLHEQLLPALHEVQELTEFAGRMRVLGKGASRVDYKNLAITLIQRSLAVGPGRAVGELRDYVEADHYSVSQRLFFGGVELKTSQDIGGDLVVMPFNGRRDGSDVIPGWRESGENATERISGCLTRVHQHPKIHRDGSGHEGGLEEVWDFSDHEDALLCMTLIGPSGPARVATSIAPTVWIPSFGGPLGQLPSESELSTFTKLNEQGLRDLSAVHRAFSALNSKRKERLRVPMTRLNLSLRRRWKVDAAIDLGIALETLFVERSWDSSIGYMLRLRAARFLASDGQRRHEMSKTLRQLYTLRSRAAHKGILPDDLDGRESKEILMDAAGIAADTIRKFIFEGEPDWQLVELGEGGPIG